MREVQSSHAKAHLPQLLTEVERGETIIITRHGRAIARIVPEPNHRKSELDSTLEEMKALGRSNGKISVEDILSARHEGHKY